MMRGISIKEFGGIEVMKLVSNLPKPTPVGNQVMVQVKYAGVNPVDTYRRSGAYANLPTLPFTPGNDGAGLVSKVGDKVTRVKEGDRVWFWKASTGSSAEFCLCPEDALGELPEDCSFQEGAMVGTTYLTAHRALFLKGKIKKGETVLIHGATGGVGNAAVQMCKNVGCRVIGTAGSSEGCEMLSKLGVDVVYNHRSESYVDDIKNSKENIDIIVEMLANVNLQHDLELIGKSDGRILIVGNRGPIEINPRSMMMNESTVTGVMLSKSTPQDLAQAIDYVNKGLRDGWVKPVLWRLWPLEKIGDAHREIMENNGAKGQFVLEI